MVKDFIKGVFKKKDQAKDAKLVSDDVPDELPPLAEDVNEKKEVAVTSAAVPDELPSLSKEPTEELDKELDTHKFFPKENAEQSAPKQDIQEDKVEKISSKVKLEEQPLENNVPDIPKVPPKPENKAEKKEEKQTQQRAPTDVLPAGFFSNILKHVKAHGVAKEKVLSGDLFSRMSNYWELRKESIKTGKLASNEQMLEDEIIKKLSELQAIENKWQTQKMAIEEDLKYLHEREKEIQLRAQELKRLTDDLKLFKNVEPKHYFCLHNGMVIKNLHELIDSLEVIDHDTFSYHVNKQRNDFADWIEHTIKDITLANKLRRVETKDEMISLLETEPVNSSTRKSRNMQKHLDSKQFFWLVDGVVIKDLYELSDALRDMDDETFRKHVNEKGNDFSKWIHQVFDNSYLANKFAKAKTRQEMIDLLEVFL